MSMKKLLVAFALSAVSNFAFGATTVTWTGKAGDMDIGNPLNWPNDTLPLTPDYSSDLPWSANPYVMVLTNTVKSYCAQFSSGPVTIDLGEGNSYLAANQFTINTENKNYLIKSGTIGVDYNDTAGNRFFIGNGGPKGGNTIVVTGSTARISSSYQNVIQVGTNYGRQRLEVVDGATIYGNVVVGQNRQSGDTNTNNVLIVNNATHYSPAKSIISPLQVAVRATKSTAIYTNNAVLNCESSLPIYIPGCESHLRARGMNKLIVTDGSVFNIPKSGLYLGYCGDYNTLEISGGAKVDCNSFSVTYNVDSGARTTNEGKEIFDYEYKAGAFSHNYATIRGEGSEVFVRSNCNIGGFSYDSQLMVEDGALLCVSNTFTVGGSTATNTVATISTNGVLDVWKGFGINSGCNNKLILDGGTLYFTNTFNTGRNFYCSSSGYTNGMEIINGGEFVFKGPSASFYVGQGGGTDVGGYCYVRNGGKMTFKDTNVIRMGLETNARDPQWVIDNATVAITNEAAQGYIGVGHNGSGALLEVTNGGLFSFSNMNFVAGANNVNASNCLIRVTNGSRFEGIITGVATASGPPEKANFVVGQWAAAGLEVSNGGVLKVPHILRFSCPNSWATIANGGTCEVYRVIMCETSRGAKLSISNGYLTTHTYILGRKTEAGGLQLGANNANSISNQVFVTGKSSALDISAGVSFGKCGLLEFDIGKEGLRTDRPVIECGSTVTAEALAVNEFKPTIRIVDDPDRVKGGTFTLIKAKGSDINWTKFNVENDNPDVTIVEQSARKLIVRARSREGLVIFVR